MLKKGVKIKFYLDKNRYFTLSELSSFSKEEKMSIISFLKKQIEDSRNVIPVSIFNDSLSSLEAIVKYLKEESALSFVKISKLLDRSDKTVWTTYQKAKKKMPSNLILDYSKPVIPPSIFKNRVLSVLENIVFYLRDEGLGFSEIARLIHRNYRTVLTVYHRAIKKGKSEKI